MTAQSTAGVRADPAGAVAPGRADREPAIAFEEIARLAVDIARAPLAFVSIVDGDRSFWHIAMAGHPGTPPRRAAAFDRLGERLIAVGGPVVVDDASPGRRSGNGRADAAPRVGAWVGHPIHGYGAEILGGLFAVSAEPRRWTDREVRTLAALAAAATKEIALRDALDVAEVRLAEMTRAHRVAVELARTLQESLLPPLLPGIPGAQVAARYRAAGTVEVMGDFYDLFHVVGGWWCTVIGDVCGHGVEAAKVTALARYTLRADANLHERPSVVLTDLDRALKAQNGIDGRYLTSAYATFRIDGARLDGQLCLAGHPAPVIRRADGAVSAVGTPGSLLGALPRLTLTDVDFHLDPGDLLLLYTDGLTERLSADDVEFGEGGLVRSVAETAGLNANDTIAYVMAAADAFGHAAATDDTALLAIQVTGP